jgi:signal transduction histidine kinase
LHSDIASCLRQLWAEIRAWDAKVTVLEGEVVLCADPTPLKYALTNLLANALIFVALGVSPKGTGMAAVVRGVCRFEVTDNGIGIRPEDPACLLILA